MARLRRFWSVTLGMRAVRVSAYDSHGGEFFAIVGQGGSGRENREARDVAAEAVEREAASGRDPGPVSLIEEEEAEA